MTKCTGQAQSGLSMIRGDSATFHFHREDVNGTIIRETPTDVFFTVKNTFDDQPFVIQKKMSDGTITEDSNYEYHITILPEDTNNLEFGEYVYDVEVIRNAEGTDKQTISKGSFTLETEVTYASNEGGE